LRSPSAWQGRGRVCRYAENIARPIRIFRVKTGEKAVPAAALSFPDKPSIAVLPFANNDAALQLSRAGVRLSSVLNQALGGVP